MPRPNGNGKKTHKPKFLSDEMNELLGAVRSEEEAAGAKPPRRAPAPRDEEEALPTEDGENVSPNKPFPSFPGAARKRKLEISGADEIQGWQKNFLDCMEKQAAVRSDSKECLLRSLSTMTKMLDTDAAALKDSEQALQLLISNVLKRNKHSLATHNQRVNALKEIQQKYQKQCELLETQQRDACNAMADEMAEKMNKLKEKLVKESRRSQMEALRKSMMYAMEYDM